MVNVLQVLRGVLVQLVAEGAQLVGIRARDREARTLRGQRAGDSGTDAARGAGTGAVIPLRLNIFSNLRESPA